MTTRNLYIHVRGWDKFQHYKKRNPPWIRVYGELLSRDSFLNLTYHQRGLLLSIWIAYSRNAHRDATDARGLSDNTLTLSRRLGHRVLTRDLKELEQAGYIVFSLAERYQDIRTETETETETSTSFVTTTSRGRELLEEQEPALTDTASTHPFVGEIPTGFDFDPTDCRVCGRPDFDPVHRERDLTDEELEANQAKIAARVSGLAGRLTMLDGGGTG